MSLTLITAYTSLRVLVGAAGVGYSIYANRIAGNTVDPEDIGKFNFDKIPEAIFGQAIGGVIYDFLKGGTTDTLDQYLRRISAINPNALNHDLQRAAAKASLLATYFACQSCLADIKSNRQGFFRRAAHIVWKDADTESLKAVSKNLRDEIARAETAAYDDKIDYQELFGIFNETGDIAVTEKKQEQLAADLKAQTIREIETASYYKFGGHKAVDLTKNALKLLSDAINDGWEQYEEDEDSIVQLKLFAYGTKVKKHDWFQLLCVIFNEEYKVNERVEAAIQKQTAREQTALLEQIQERMQSFGRIENFNDLERQIAGFREENFLQHQITHKGIGELKEGQTEIKNLIRQISPEKQNEPQTFVSLPELSEKIYGRNQEIAGILDFLNGDKKHGVIVAPTCFGKTYLVKKFLYRTIEISRVKPEYQVLFAKVVYLDCRTNTTFDNIVRFFATMRGETLEYRTGDETNFLRQDVFGKIQTEKILLVFDNFESWITKTGAYVNETVELFLRIFFNANHQIRGFFVSQKVPINERNFLAVKKLEAISDELLEGLDEAAALELARKEGAEVGLDTIPEADLKRFFERVYYIPQAIQSMIGYLATVGVSFHVCELDFWRDFDAEESRADDAERTLDDKLRPTKALIRLQISKQDSHTEQLLSLLAFFENPVPKEVLLLDFKAAAPAAFSPESHKAVNNLVINRLAQTEIDAVKDIDYRTGIAEDIVYYRLHPFFRDIVRQLFLFETENADFLTKYAGELVNKGNQAHRSNRFRKAIAFYVSAKRIETYLVNEKGDEARRDALANTYIGKGISLDRQGRLPEAIAEYDEAIEILEQLLNEEQRGESAKTLAGTYMNKGITLASQGRLPEAIAEYDKTIAIRERKVNEEQRGELPNELATVYVNKGIVLKNQGDLTKAIAEFDKAIKIYERKVNEEQRGELANELATVYVNKGVALANQDNLTQAIAEFDKAIGIFDRLVNKKQRGELSDDLAGAVMNKGIVLKNQGKLSEGIAEYNRAIEIYERLIGEEQRDELENTLAKGYMNKGLAFEDIPDLNASLESFDTGIEWWEKCLAKGDDHVLPDYVKGLAIRVGMLIKLEDYIRATGDILAAFGFINLLEEPAFPEYFKQKIARELRNILFQISNLPAEKREEIYKHAGEYGEVIRQYVNNFEEMPESS